MDKYICIDIGGTVIKYGIATAEGNFLSIGGTPTEAKEKGIGQCLQKILELIDRICQENCIRGVAVATAGIVEVETGNILHASSSLPGYSGTKLRELITEHCHLPCAVENDVNAAGLGEYWRGAGSHSRSLCCITVGTGIGSCLILDGKLVHGISCSAGEIGYIRIDGKPLEEKCSVTSLIKRVAAAKGHPEAMLDGRIIFDLAKKRDISSMAAIEEMITSLAQGITNICYMINPELIILGGGIMAQSAYIQPLLQKKLQKFLIPFVYDHTRITFAKLGNQAGMTGALYYLLEQLKRGE